MPAYDVGVIIGSLRKASYNRRVYEQSASVAPAALALREIPIWELPLFDQDVQESPTAVIERYWATIREVDAILFVSPEYNYSLPGVLKNAIDWASRPPKSAPLLGKPAAVFGASSGRSGTMRMQLQLRPILACLDMPVMPLPEVFIDHVRDRFDDAGRLSDERLLRQMTGFYAAFASWIRLCKLRHG